MLGHGIRHGLAHDLAHKIDHSYASPLGNPWDSPSAWYIFVLIYTSHAMTGGMFGVDEICIC